MFISEKDAWGCGYGTKAARLILDFAFSRVGLNRMFLRVLRRNQAAIRSYEKTGLKQRVVFARS